MSENKAENITNETLAYLDEFVNIVTMLADAHKASNGTLTKEQLDKGFSLIGEAVDTLNLSLQMLVAGIEAEAVQPSEDAAIIDLQAYKANGGLLN